MKINQILTAIAFASTIALTACGGGGGGGSDSSNSGGNTTTSTTPIVPTDAQILADIAISQSTASNTPVWNTSQPYNSVGNPYTGNVDGVHSYRWNIERDGLIPVLDNSGRPEVATALTNLETAAGKQLFNRLPAGTTVASMTRGLVINNAVPPTQGATEPNNCGQVYASTQNMFSLWVDPSYSINPPLSADWQAQVNSSPLINPRTVFNVDINFGVTACAPMEPLVEHEMFHALGLSNHFDGFGEGSGGNCNGAICTDRAYPVLKTLYANPPYTLISSMVIAR